MPFYLRECTTKSNGMNIKMLKAALAGLILPVSGLANAGLIFTEVKAELNATIPNNTYSESILDSVFAENNNITDNLGLLISQSIELDIIDSKNISLIYSHSYKGNNDGLLQSYSLGGSYATFDYFASSTTIVYIDFEDIITGNNAFGIKGLTLLGDFSNSLGSSFTLGAFSGSTSYTLTAGQTYNFTFNFDSDISGLISSFDRTQVSTANFRFETTSVPEPSTLAIFALGIMGLASRRFKKQYTTDSPNQVNHRVLGDN